MEGSGRQDAGSALSAEELEQPERLRPTLLPVIEGVLAAHPNEVECYRGGQSGIPGFLLAQMMKQAGQGGIRPNPRLVSAILAQELGAT